MARLLVTRPEPDASRTAAELAQDGHEVTVAPLMQPQPVPADLPAPGAVSALAVTSANALRALADADALAPFLALPLFAVGDSTAAEARSLGFAQIESAGGTASDLADMIANRRFDKPVFCPAARHQAADLAGLLSGRGVAALSAIVYDMVPVSMLPSSAQTALEAGSIDAVLLYSRRSAAQFLALSRDLDLSQIAMLCLSANIADALAGAATGPVHIAAHPDGAALRALARSFAAPQNGP